ncbi:MAG: O-antigen ligase family protein [Ginsengibacter sp.]
MLPINGALQTNRVTIKLKDVTFWFTVALFSLALWISLVLTTATPLVIITLPLIAYDRAYFFPVFMAIPLAQGAFITDVVDTDTFAESIALATVAPLLLFDVLRLKSKIVPYRFVVFYVLFGFFIILGCFVYYQHATDNYKGLNGAPHWKAIVKSVVKLFKITFFFIYLKVLINYPKAMLIKTLEFSRKMAPFIVSCLGVYLLVYGRMQSGAAASASGGTLQMGDAHHGAFTSQLSSLGIFMYITFFSRKEYIWNKILAFVSLVLMFIMIMQMGSRNGLLCFALVSCVGLYVNLKNRRLDYQFLIVLGVTIVAVLAIYLSLSSPTIQRAIYMTEVEGGGNRWYYWDAGVKALERNPILGMGGDESASIGAVAKYAPAGIDDKVMHNSYLEMAVEYGLVGLLFYITFLLVVLKWSYRLFKYALSRNMLILAAPSVSYLILMVSALFVSRIWETAIWYNLCFVMACCIQWIYPQYISSKKRVNTYSPLMEQMRQTGTPLPYA